MSVSSLNKVTSSALAIKCDSMECKNMTADTFTILSAEVDTLTVNTLLTGEADIQLDKTLADGGLTYLESGESLQHLMVKGTAIAHRKNDIRAFHCACDATAVGGAAHQAYSGIQDINTGDGCLTLHTSDGTDYDLTSICQKGSDTSTLDIKPTEIDITSANLNANITTKITLNTPAIQTTQIINGVLRVDGTGNISANAGLSQLSDVILTGLAAQDQLVYDGTRWTNSQVSSTYTPVFGDFTNISAITLWLAWYTIVGNVITVSIRCRIDSVAAAQSVFSVTLPIPFSVAQADNIHICGNCMQNSNPTTASIVLGFIGTTDKAQCNFTAISTAPIDSTINFSYLLI